MSCVEDLRRTFFNAWCFPHLSRLENVLVVRTKHVQYSAEPSFGTRHHRLVQDGDSHCQDCNLWNVCLYLSQVLFPSHFAMDRRYIFRELKIACGMEIRIR